MRTQDQLAERQLGMGAYADGGLGVAAGDREMAMAGMAAGHPEIRGLEMQGSGCLCPRSEQAPSPPSLGGWGSRAVIFSS